MRFVTLTALTGFALVACMMLNTTDATNANQIPREFSLRPTAPVTIELNAGSFDPCRESVTFGKGAGDAATSYGEQYNPYRIVQFDGSIRRDWQLELEAAGAEIVGYVPHNAYLVRVPEEVADTKWKAPAKHIRWTDEYLPTYKYRDSLLTEIGQPELGGDRIRLHAVMFRGERADSVMTTVGSAAPSLTVYTVHYGLEDERERTEAVVVDVDVAELSTTVTNLSRIPAVEWIEKGGIPRLANNYAVGMIQSGRATGLDATPLFEKGVIGLGQIVAVLDSGLDSDGCQFRFGPWPDQQTFANDILAPESHITNPTNKVTTYYVLPFADAYDNDYMHGTAVAGCVAGDNYVTLAGLTTAGHDDDSWDGMAPGAQIVFQDAGGSDDGFYAMIVSQQLIHKQAYDSGARIHNNSWGWAFFSPFYDSMSAEVDHMVWRYNDYSIVYCAQNYGPSSYTLAGVGSTAKNTIVVGATEGTTPQGTLDDPNNDGRGAENLTAYSSHGPTRDFRFKPDIVAPGNVFSATEGDPLESTIAGRLATLSRTFPPNDNCDAKHVTGTSFASPIVAGGAALVRQYFFDGYYPSGARNGLDAFNPSGALVKAVIINSGKDLTSEGMTGRYTADDGTGGASGPVPSFGQGWGRLTLDDTLYFTGDTRNLLVLNDVYNGVGSQDFAPTITARTPSITTGETHSFTIPNVEPGEPLKVTLAWSDPAASPSSYFALVNDLDLLVVSPSGLEYHGNTAFSQGYSQPLNASDTTESFWPYLGDYLNNVENVFIQSPEAGSYTVRVYGWNVPGSGAEFPFSSSLQGYALVATGSFSREVNPMVSFLTASLEGGDDDQFLDPGEDARVRVSVENIGMIDAIGVNVTLSLKRRSEDDMYSPPLRLVDPDRQDVYPETLTETVGLLAPGEQADVEFDVRMEEWLLDYEWRKARFGVAIETPAGTPTDSEFVVDLAKNVDVMVQFDFDDGDLTEWILRQDGEGTDPVPGITECETSSPEGRSGPKALKFGPLDDCDAEYSVNDKLVAISPPFPVALGQDLVSLNFFQRFNTELGFDFCEVYLDRNGDGWFSPVDLVTRFSGGGSTEMTYVRLPISSFNENRTDTLRLGFVFRSDEYVTVPTGWIIDDISVTATSEDMGSQSTPLVPLILDVEPRRGPLAGDALVSITGQNFGTEPLVFFGTKQGTVVSVEPIGGISPNSELRVLTPPAEPGLVDVEVVNPANGKSDTVSKAYEYAVPRDDLVTLTIRDIEAAPGTVDLEVPIILESASDAARPQSIEFTIRYDASVLDAKRVSPGTSVIDAQKTVLTDLAESGEVNIQISGDTWGLADGRLVDLVFDVSPNASGDGNAAELTCAGTAGKNVAGAELTIECVTGSVILRSTPGDLDGDGYVNAIDIQQIVNLVLAGVLPGIDDPADDNDDGMIDAVDIQRIVNRALGMFVITLSIDDADAKQLDSIAVPVMLELSSDQARPKRVQFSVQYNPLLLTAWPVVPGTASRASGMTVSSDISRLGYVDVVVESESATVGAGELARLVFDVKISSAIPAGSEVEMICGDVIAVNKDNISLSAACTGGTLTVLPWRS